MPGPAPISRPVVVAPVSVSGGNNRISQQLGSTVTPGGVIGANPLTDTHAATVIIPAGGSLMVNVPGISFYFPGVTGLTGINARPINAGQSRSFVNYAQGTGLRLGTSSFQKVELSNPDLVNANTVTIIVGGGIPNNTYDEFIDKRVIVTNQPGTNLIVQNAPTTVVGWKTRTPAWADSIANGITVTVTDGYTAHGRKAISVCNNDTGAALLTLQDAGGSTIATIQPSTAFYLETGGTVKVNNASGGAVSCNICEIYYT